MVCEIARSGHDRFWNVADSNRAYYVGGGTGEEANCFHLELGGIPPQSSVHGIFY